MEKSQFIAAWQFQERHRLLLTTLEFCFLTNYHEFYTSVGYKQDTEESTSFFS